MLITFIINISDEQWTINTQKKTTSIWAIYSPDKAELSETLVMVNFVL